VEKGKGSEYFPNALYIYRNKTDPASVASVSVCLITYWFRAHQANLTNVAVFNLCSAVIKALHIFFNLRPASGII
jgi:hypothetical protein